MFRKILVLTVFITLIFALPPKGQSLPASPPPAEPEPLPWEDDVCLTPNQSIYNYAYSYLANWATHTPNNRVYGVWYRTTTNYPVIMRWWDQSGSWSPEETVTANANLTFTYNYYPSISGDSNNNVHFAWRGYPTSPAGYWVFYRAKMANGNYTNICSIPNPSAGYYNYYAKIAAGKGDTAHIAMYSYANGNYVIRYAKVKMATWPIVVETLTVSPPGWTSQYYPHIAVDGQNRVHVVWYGYITIGSSYYNIFYRMRNASGQWGPVETVSVFNYSYYNYYPRVAIDGNGNVHVVWYAYTSNDYYYHIAHRVKTASGWSDVTLLPPTTSYYWYYPTCAVSPDNKLHVAFYTNAWGSYYNIGRYIRNPDGSWEGPDTVTNFTDSYYRYYPEIVCTRDGNIHIFRMDYAPYTNYYYWIYYKRFRVINYDVSVKAIVAPAGLYSREDVVTPQAIIKNYGVQDANNFTVKMYIDPGNYYSYVTISLPAGAETTVSFASWQPNESTWFRVKCTTDFYLDENPNNNKKTGMCAIYDYYQNFQLSNGGYETIPAPSGYYQDWQYGEYGMPNDTLCWATPFYRNNSNSRLNSCRYVALVDTPIVAYYHWYYTESYWDGYNVKCSIPGQPWQIIHAVPGLGQPYTMTIYGLNSESAYCGNQQYWTLNWLKIPVSAGSYFWLRFHFGSDASVTYWGVSIDKVYGIGFVRYAYNVGVKEILQPIGDVPKLPIEPKMIVKNYGIYTASFPSYFRIYDEGGNLVYSDTRLVASLAPGKETTVVFNTWTPGTTGYFTVKGITNYSLDEDRSDDTLTEDIYVYWIDVGIKEIIQPVGGYAPGTKLTPKCKIKNYGSEIAWDVPAKCSIPDINYLSEKTIDFIEPYGEVEVEFDTMEVTAGTHTVYFWTTTDGDLNPNNDWASGPYNGGILDVGATQILSPTGNILRDPNVPKPVSGKVKNFGDYPWSFWTFFKIYKGDNLVYIDSSYNTVNPNTEITLNFTPYLCADTGNFTTILKTALVGDINPANDSVVGSFKVILLTPGWHKMADVTGATKPVKSGGALCALGDKVYALVGNNTRDLMVYDVNSKTWAKEGEVPQGPKKKNVKKGAAICTDGQYIYVAKGNNTQEFSRYDPVSKTWKEYQANFSKGIKGASMTFDGDSFIYIICGSNNNEWKRFNRYTETFEACNPATLPADKWKTGSWIVYVPGETPKIYALRVGGKTNEFYMTTIGGTWTSKPEMPLIGSTGKKKKAKEGSAGAYNPDNKLIYALKGGNTLEFFSYNPTTDQWNIELDVGKPEGTPAKRVKGGGALTYSAAAGGLFAFVGNNTNEFWFYVPGTTFLASAPTFNNGIQSEIKSLRNFTLTITKEKGYVKVAYSLPVKLTAKLTLYNALGEVVYSARSDNGYFIIDTKQLPIGIYLMKFNANEYKATRKLVIH